MMAAEAEKFSDYFESLREGDVQSSRGMLRKTFVEKISSYLIGRQVPDRKFRFYVNNNAFNFIDFPELNYSCTSE